MRVGIVGPGAIGGLFGAVLTRGGLDVTLIDKRPERAKQLSEQGIRIEGKGGTYTAPVKIVAYPLPSEPFEVVVVAVKAYDTRAATEQFAPAVGPDTAVVSVQNGLGNAEILVAAFGADRVLGGATNQGANVLATGRIDHAGVAGTTIGEIDGTISDRASRIAEAFTGAGLETAVSENIQGIIWTKLLINVAINPLVALLRVRNGVLAEHDETLDLMRLAVGEAWDVAKAKGVTLLVDDPVARAVEVAQTTAGNIASMHQDVRHGRRTEIDFITGAVVREGARVGVPTPYNQALTLLVKSIGAVRDQVVPPPA